MQQRGRRAERCGGYHRRGPVGAALFTG